MGELTKELDGPTIRRRGVVERDGLVGKRSLSATTGLDVLQGYMLVTSNAQALGRLRNEK
jgi:hypothetical protein